jgi:redox-sensitive bicupin YhaK (pirin superfamily)
VTEYTQIFVRDVVKPGKLGLLATPEGKEGAVTIHADALLYMGILAEEQEIEHTVDSGRHAWLQMVRGEIVLNGIELHSGDGAAVSEESSMKIHASKSSEFLLFDWN